MIGSRLSIARMMRGRTRRSLADSVGVTPRTISNFEMDRTNPSAEVLNSIAHELKFPLPFFQMGDIEIPSETAVSFRARSKMTRRQRSIAISTVAIAAEISNWMDDTFSLPKTDVPNLEGLEPENAAAVLRRIWGIGESPIADMIALIEFHGVRVFSVTEVSEDIDAFSTWNEKNGRPFVFLTTSKSGERRRMDAAHELGHLVMHRKIDLEGAKSKEIERQANSFASAFLMPSGEFRASTPRGLTLSQALQVKKRWRVSVSAVVFRAHELGLLTDWQYHRLFQDIGSHGMRKYEPEGLEPEVSQVDEQVIQLVSEGTGSVREISDCTNIPPEVILSLMFRMNISVLEGGNEMPSHGKVLNRNFVVV
jgi:Zn-dependent peptidase ImmA (M78 family)/DNA-binding XRE family transcriptional regulator